MARKVTADEEDDDDRPRKKKKKKKSNAALLIGLGVGGAVLLVLIVVLVVVVAINAGGNNPPRPPQPPVVQAPPIPAPPPPVKPNFDKVEIGDKPRPSGAGNLRARIDRIERINELRNIGQFYQQYVLNFNKPPASAKDFAEFIKRDAPGIKQAIDEKYYFVVPNVRAGSGIVAYEFDPDTMGRHGIVLMGGQGAHEDLTTQELVAALKAQGSG